VIFLLNSSVLEKKNDSILLFEVKGENLPKEK
jgi:hypothetical protein